MGLLENTNNQCHNITKYQCKKWLIISKRYHGTNEIIGLTNVLEYLKELKILEYRAASFVDAGKVLDWADIVVFSRVIDKDIISLLDVALSCGKTTLYYIDDSLYNVPDYARLREYYHSKEVQATLRYFIEKVHQVVTCSEWLSRSYDEKYNCKSIWLQPTIKLLPHIKKQDNSNKLIIGFAGNPDYAKRLEEIKDSFIRLYDQYKDKIQFEFFGPKVSFLNQVEGSYYSPVPYSQYEKVLARKNWDIGLAYLENSNFNNNKFYNKYLEYSRFKIAGVYSDIPLYNRIIKNEVNGLLAKNTSDDWYHKIERLIHDKEMIGKIVNSAFDEVSNQFTPQQTSEMFKQKLGKYL